MCWQAAHRRLQELRFFALSSPTDFDIQNDLERRRQALRHHPRPTFC
jgi:hypothetical protein